MYAIFNPSRDLPCHNCLVGPFPPTCQLFPLVLPKFDANSSCANSVLVSAKRLPKKCARKPLMTSPQAPNQAPADATTRQTANTTVPGLTSSSQHASASPPQLTSHYQAANTGTPSSVLRLPASNPKAHSSRTSRLLSLAKADKENWKKTKQSQNVQVDVSKTQNVPALSMATESVSSSPGLASPTMGPGMPIKQSLDSSPHRTVAAGSIPTKMINGVKPDETVTSRASSLSLPSQVSYSHSARSPAAIQNGNIMAGPSQSTECKLPEPTSIHFKRNVAEKEQPPDLTKTGPTFKFLKREKDGLANSFKDFLVSSNTETRDESASQIAAHFVNLVQDFISPRYENVKGLFMSDKFDGPSSSSLSNSHLKRARSSSENRDDGRPPTRLKLDSGERTTNTDDDRNATSSSYPLVAETSSRIYSHRPDTVKETRLYYPPNRSFSHVMTVEFDGDELALLDRWANRHNTFDPSLPCLSCTLACVVLPDLAKYPKDKSREEIFDSLAIEWPQEGGFSITLRADHSVPISLPIAPPSLIRNFEPIDLTSYLKSKTDITFTSARDYSKYALIFRVHAPTQSQLRQFRQASSILSPASDAWANLRLIDRPISPVRLLLSDLSL